MVSALSDNGVYGYSEVGYLHSQITAYLGIQKWGIWVFRSGVFALSDNGVSGYSEVGYLHSQITVYLGIQK